MNKNDEFEIDLLKLIRTLWSKVLVIILVALVAASISFAATLLFVTPTYKASVSMYVNNSSFSLGSTSFSISASELNATNSLVRTYIYILKSRTTMEDVIARSGVPYSYKALAKMVSATATTGTGAFDIVVTSASPTEAELIANTFASVLPDRISEIVDGSSVRIIDYAIVPAQRSSPSFTKNTVVGFLVGAFLAVAIIAVKFLIDESNDVVIHSADELRNLYPDISVLALIPDMRLSAKKGYYYSSYYGEKKDDKEEKGGK